MSGERGRSLLRWLGITAAVVIGVCGLAVIAGFLILLMAVESWGSNK